MKARKQDMAGSICKECMEEQDEIKIVKMPCENCGKIVKIIVPFVGCVFCNDCMRGDSSWDASTEQIQYRWKIQ